MFSRPTGFTLLDRIIGVAKLDVPTYEAIKADPEAFGQAALVVLVTGVATNVWVAAFAPNGGVRALGGITLAFLAWLLFAELV